MCLLAVVWSIFCLLRAPRSWNIVFLGSNTFKFKLSGDEKCIFHEVFFFSICFCLLHICDFHFVAWHLTLQTMIGLHFFKLHPWFCLTTFVIHFYSFLSFITCHLPFTILMHPFSMVNNYRNIFFFFHDLSSCPFFSFFFLFSVPFFHENFFLFLPRGFSMVNNLCPRAVNIIGGLVFLSTCK